MRSSSDEDESETLFPSANERPLGEDHGPAVRFPPELSPPTSQDPPDPTEWEGFQDEIDDKIPQNASDMARSKDDKQYKGVALGLNGSSSHKIHNGDNEPSGVENEPGYAWRNPKAMEEYLKGMGMTVDRNFSLRKNPMKLGFHFGLTLGTGEFGDPFDERENETPEPG